MKMDEVGRTGSTHGGRERCLQAFFGQGRPKGKRPLGRPRHRWEDNIKMDLRETGINRVSWIRPAQDWV
jgi:hypothetical protein